MKNMFNYTEKVKSQYQGEPDVEILNITKIIIHSVGLVVILLAILFLNPFTTIGAGERGVVLNWGAFNGQIFQPGLNIKIPFMQRIIKTDVQTKKIEIGKSEAYSHDLQVVDIHSVVNYNIDPMAVGEVYKQFGLDYESKILIARIEAGIKQTIAKYTAEELLSKRGEVSSQIEEAIKSTFPSQFVNVKYQLSNESFSDQFEKAIEAKQVAQQDAERAKNELTKAEIDAKARIASAQGEAEAIKIQAQAINSQGGADYVQLQAIKQWHGDVPMYMMSGSAVPFINLNK